jgi:predicted PurR-regulated permease PerM
VNVLLVLMLLYAAILVLALAIGLMAIAYFVNGARASLAQIAGGLKQVDRHVAPLQPALTAVNDGLTTLFANLQQVQNNLASANTALPEERRAS